MSIIMLIESQTIVRKAVKRLNKTDTEFTVVLEVCDKTHSI